MSETNRTGREGRTDRDESDSEKTRDHAEIDRPTNLTAFQQEILLHLAQAGEDYGLGIKRGLEDRYGEEVHHGRIYPNLDELVAKGLVAKSSRDQRTNEYTLTSRGRRLVEADARHRAEIAGVLIA